MMPLLEHEKQIFLDAFHDDGLLITAKYVKRVTQVIAFTKGSGKLSISTMEQASMVEMDLPQ